MGKPVFIEDSDKRGCCNRCCHVFISNDCLNSACNSIDREDGKSGYFVKRETDSLFVRFKSVLRRWL